MRATIKRAVVATTFGLTAIGLVGGVAAKEYGPGVSDTEIKIGHIGPYSGPASAYGQIGKAIAAYIEKVNDEGGVNGRKINLVSMDDGYNPAKTVEQARKLVEQEEVLGLFNSLGTPTNSAIHRYMNAKKVPHLFLATGATKWGNPEKYKWTMGWQPNYQSEAKVYAAHILDTNPGAKVAILYQNDDYGKDYLEGFKAGLGDKAKDMIVSEVSYEVTDPTIDSQMVTMKASGADTFFNVTTPKFAAQAIKKAAEIGWKPTHYLNNVSQSVGSVLKPAGFENSLGILSTGYLKDPTDTRWQSGKEWDEWLAWMNKYQPGGDLTNSFNVFGPSVAQTLVQTLKQMGDELTRENFVKQAANLDIQLPMLMPGVKVKTSPTDYYPIEALQMFKFDGKGWEPFGKIYGN